MIAFRVKIDDAAVLRALEGLIDRAQGPAYRRLQERIGELYRRDAESRFESQTTPSGKRWKRNTPATRRLKQFGGLRRGPAKLGPDVVGTWTGTLRASIRSRIEGDTVTIGSGVEHAGWFQNGTRGGWGPAPARPFLGESSESGSELRKLLERHFEVQK